MAVSPNLVIVMLHPLINNVGFLCLQSEAGYRSYGKMA